MESWRQLEAVYSLLKQGHDRRETEAERRKRMIMKLHQDRRKR